MSVAALTVLPYHREVATRLEAANPKAFAALMPAARPAPPGTGPETDQELLRNSYRLEAAAHPDTDQAARRAADALAVTVPVQLWATDGAEVGSAELLYQPDRAVVLLGGATLNLLDADELSAVIGHELAHHLLWTADGGRYLSATRLLDTAEGDARTPVEYLETARRWRLATELYADRGGLLAGGSLAATLRGLVKLSTGLAVVDADAYLRQAAEVDLSRPTVAATHPETVLRAWALQQWQQDPSGADDQLARLLAPRLDLTALDLPDQARLGAMTGGLITAVLADARPAGEDMNTLARRFDVATRVEVCSLGEIAAARPGLAPATRRYLAAVLLDFATVEDSPSEDLLPRMIALGRRAGLGPELEKLAVAELGLTPRAWSRVVARAAEVA